MSSFQSPHKLGKANVTYDCNQESIITSTKANLQEAWEQSRPCATCELQDICRLQGVMRTRPDFPREYWKVTIECIRYRPNKSTAVPTAGNTYTDNNMIDSGVMKPRARKVYGDNGQYK